MCIEVLVAIIVDASEVDNAESIGLLAFGEISEWFRRLFRDNKISLLIHQT